MPLDPMDSDSVSIAYLILAHHEPAVFQRLTHAIAHKGCSIHAHIDRKAAFRAFAEGAHPSVRYLRPRQALNWCGWSLADGLLRLLAQAYEATDSDYFIYLAGTDFPIASHDRLVRYLEAVYPSNLLNYYPAIPGLWCHSLTKSISLIDERTLIGSLHDRLPSQFSKHILQLEEAFDALLARARTSAAMPRSPCKWLFHGSSRWCLNRETVGSILNFMDTTEGHALEKHLKLLSNADEFLVPSIVLSSDLKHQCLNYSEERMKGLHENPPWFEAHWSDVNDKSVFLHYIDWTPTREDPAVLDLSDLDSIRSSEKFFACKFLIERSSSLMKALEQVICS